MKSIHIDHSETSITSNVLFLNITGCKKHPASCLESYERFFKTFFRCCPSAQQAFHNNNTELKVKEKYEEILTNELVRYDILGPRSTVRRKCCVWRMLNLNWLDRHSNYLTYLEFEPLIYPWAHWNLISLIQISCSIFKIGPSSWSQCIQ